MKLFLSVITLSMVTGCVTHIAPYERKERHYEPDNYANENGGRSVGSLWGDASSSFFEDVRARRVGDIITIVIEESANAARGASTKASSDSSAEAGVTALLEHWPKSSKRIQILRRSSSWVIRALAHSMAKARRHGREPSARYSRFVSNVNYRTVISISKATKSSW